ncbi:unnamed protein product [Dovyalis caffra]|uniref:Uncharacterized protein n=1 Tax=Dovyalis caffra TaxID=77055 RepID=A0AAV1SVJ8_9ROSI|nr:unnamed protein product [Dovyalis caffra]
MLLEALLVEQSSRHEALTDKARYPMKLNDKFGNIGVSDEVVLAIVGVECPVDDVFAQRLMLKRLPFFDNALDIVHSMHVLSNWIPDAMLEFTLNECSIASSALDHS